MVYSVQVKRLRHEEPIEALVVRGAKRKRADDDKEDPFVFRLARTYDTQQKDKHVFLEGSSSNKNTPSEQAENVFAIAEKKRQKRSNSGAGAGESQANATSENTELVPAELQSMIAEYMNAEKAKDVAVSPETSDKETEDYVYDVYFGDKAGPVAGGNIGYIDVDEDEEKLLFGDSNSDSDSSLVKDEDDSNAEDYYGNEYPEDEDEDEGEFGSDLDELLEDKLGDLRLDPEWSEEEEADNEDASYNRYGWR